MFKKAERKQIKIKIALTGPSGSGKTYSALKLAAGLGKKIAVIDTENGSASLYAGTEGMPDFQVVEIGPPYLTKKYQDAIQAAITGGFDVLVIDSISHQWNGVGGILNRKEQEEAAKPGSNGYTLWVKYTPEHEAFKSYILHAPIHIISTMRSKQDYVMQTNEKGKQTPKKVGLAPIQREGMEYEYTTVFDIAIESHMASTSKDRTGLFDGFIDRLDVKHGELISEWIKTGKELKPQSVNANRDDVPDHKPPTKEQADKKPEAPNHAKLSGEIRTFTRNHMIPDDVVIAEIKTADPRANTLNELNASALPAIMNALNRWVMNRPKE